jgi:hypothetical protein
MHEAESESYDYERDRLCSEIINKKEQLHWVENSMLNIYLDKGSITKASKATGISQAQVKRILTNAKQKMKTNITGKLLGNYICGSIDVVIDVQDNITPENVNDILATINEYIRFKLEKITIPSTNAHFNKIEDIRIKKVI